MTNQESVIDALISIELKHANESFPPFASAHEGWAVLKEEIDEVEDAHKCVTANMARLWGQVKCKKFNPDNYDVALSQIEEWGIEEIKELIQVVAMVRKFKALIK